VGNIKGLIRARFWMTFSDNYLNHLRVLKNVGMTRIDEVDYEGCKIVPVKFLKALLPEPASLGTGYTGKTVIRECDDREEERRKHYTIYLQCMRPAEAFRETGTRQSHIPPASRHDRIDDGCSRASGRSRVYNVEQLDPDRFMEAMNRYGLPWQVPRIRACPAKVSNPSHDADTGIRETITSVLEKDIIRAAKYHAYPPRQGKRCSNRWAPPDSGPSQASSRKQRRGASRRRTNGPSWRSGGLTTPCTSSTKR